MMNKPGYFEEVRSRAAQEWDWKEQHSESSWVGGSMTLLEQVKNGRHVLSELLQNADDADAKNVKASLSGNQFTFWHDGRDFSRDEFTSLCRYAFSNKRRLQTIGFRGIGFKSTFSLGASVELRTESLAVRFNEARFFEPVWIDGTAAGHVGTEVRVEVHDDEAANLLEESFAAWRRNPASLLFFRHVETLEVQGEILTRSLRKAGPVPGSSWVELSGVDEQSRVLLVESGYEEFPDEAKDEIKRQRQVPELELPSVAVQLVLGLSDQGVYSVLPSGVQWALPFSCNAPFMLTPDRGSLSANSPTNRWLLHRVGSLAASTMKLWLANDGLTKLERANAYGLLPNGEEAEPGIAADTQRAVVDSFAKALGDDPAILLTHRGRLANRSGCIAVPPELQEVWDGDTLVGFLIADAEAILAEEVEAASRANLARMGVLRQLRPADAVRQLRESLCIPKPESLAQLVVLWAFVLKQKSNLYGKQLEEIKIVPVSGGDQLLAACEVINAGDKDVRLTESEWAFLVGGVSRIDSDWLGFVRAASEEGGAKAIDSAIELLKELKIDRKASPERLVAAACNARFGNAEDVDSSAAIELALIVAKLAENCPKNLPFVLRSGACSFRSEQLVALAEERDEELYPNEWKESHALNSRYYDADGDGSWEAWTHSNRCRVGRYPVPQRLREESHSKERVKNIAADRGAAGTYWSFPYQSAVAFFDADFPAELVQHWDSMPDEAGHVRVLKGLLLSPRSVPSDLSVVELKQEGYTYTKKVTGPTVPTAWVMRFRSKACLPDETGVLRRPAELLLNGPATEPYRGVEPFVSAELDTPSNRELLLLLGARDTATGVDKLLERVRALATVAETESVVAEIDRWYTALARVHSRASQAEWEKVKSAFEVENLVLCNESQWGTVFDSFLSEERLVMEGDKAIHPAVRGNALWRVLDVRESPKASDMLGWLERLQTENRLSPNELKRVKQVLRCFPQQAWEEQRVWVGLDGRLHTADSFRFRLRPDRLPSWKSLFDRVKSQTADMMHFSDEDTAGPLFGRLDDLATAVTLLPRADASTPDDPTVRRGWLRAFGLSISKVVLPSGEDQRRLQELGKRLAVTSWQWVNSLTVEPYLEGTPAGEPQKTAAAWHESTLYVQEDTDVRVMGVVVSELARSIGHPRVTEALRACYERSVDFVCDYLAENFELEEPNEPEEVGAPRVDVSLADSFEGEDPSGDSSWPLTSPGNGDVGGVATATSGPRVQRRERQPKQEPVLISRFATSRGFVWDEGRRLFEHPDGDLITSGDSPFSWVIRSEVAARCRHLWVADQTYGGIGLNLPAPVWDVVRQSPSVYAFVLLDTHRQPVFVKCEEIVRRKDSGELTVSVANYRLFETRRP